MPTVKLFGVLKDRAGKNRVFIPGKKTILEILTFLSEKYGPRVKDLLIEKQNGEMKRRTSVVILIEGMAQVDLQREVEEEEVVTIFPSVAGG